VLPPDNYREASSWAILVKDFDRTVREWEVSDSSDNVETLSPQMRTMSYIPACGWLIMNKWTNIGTFLRASTIR